MLLNGVNRRDDVMVRKLDGKAVFRPEDLWIVNDLPAGVRDEDKA